MTIASGASRLLRALLLVAFTVLTLSAAGIALLAWRLSEGPLDLAWAARRAEAAYNDRADATARLAIGGAALRWRGFKQAGYGLEFTLSGVRLSAPDGAPAASIASLAFTLSPTRLLSGVIAPQTIAVSGAGLHLTRSADGAVSLSGIDPAPGDPAAAVNVDDTVAELSRPAREGEPSGRSDIVRRLSQLREAHLTDASVEVQDQALGKSWSLKVGQLDLQRQSKGGVQGQAQATVAFDGSPPAALSLQAVLAPSGGTQLRAALAPLEAAPLGALLQQAAGVDAAYGLDAKIGASAILDLSPSLLPAAATLHAEAGPGGLLVSGVRIATDALSLDAEAKWRQPRWTRPSSLALTRGKAVLRPPGDAPPTTILASARAAQDGSQINATVDASLDQLAFSNLADLWPEPLGGHVRPWMTENMTAGIARDGVIKLGLVAPPDLKTVRITAVDGSVTGQDVTVWWLRPVPPIEHASAKLTITNPDSLDIAVPTGRQGTMALKDGLVRITGLSKQDQVLAIDADASGSVPALLALLKNPRLNLLSKKPIPMRNPSGSFAGHLSVKLPLNEDLTFEQVKIGAQAHLARLNLGGIVAHRDLEHGELDLQASSDALDIKGSASIGGIDAAIAVGMDFRDGPPSQVVERATANGRATSRQLGNTGFDPGGLIESGAALLTASYEQRRNGRATLSIDADLKDAGLALAGWRKPQGPAATVQAQLLLEHGQLIGIESLQAKGPGLSVEGRAKLAANGPNTLIFDTIEIGPTKATGEIQVPKTPGLPIRATISGPVLDLSTTLAKNPAPPPAKTAPPGPDTPWVADIRFDRVLLSNGPGLVNVVAHAENDGRRLAVVRIASSGPERLQAAMQPDGAGRRLTVAAADGGALLRSLDLIGTVDGGRLTLDARFDDTQPDPPLTGAAELKDFHLRKAPAIGKLLQAATIYGVGEALSGPGLYFDELILPFRYHGSQLDITDARATSDSLGLTGKGVIDTAHSTLDLQGTIVPAYVVNSLLGRVPILGRLFRSERGGGLIAMNYAVHGSFDDPSVSVNPLSVLTPGALRRLFHLTE